MECGLGFEIVELKDFPGEYCIKRNGRPYSSSGAGYRTSHLSKEAAKRIVKEQIKAIKKNPPSFTRPNNKAKARE